MRKVCIIQDELLPGGATQVAANIIKVLNADGIKPDIYSYDTPPELSAKDFSSTYGLNATLRKVPDLGLKRVTLYKNYFLLKLLKGKLSNYDLVFNCGQCLSRWNSPPSLVNYIHFPYPLELNEPGDYHSLNSIRKLYLMPLRWMNSDGTLCSDYGSVIANSRFTKGIIESLYRGLKGKVSVIYPPVQLDLFWDENLHRKDTVTSIGRFEPQKRQLEQVQIAGQIPELTFLIAGFINSPISEAYFNVCKRYALSHNFTNIEFIPNIDKLQAKRFLHSSKYFLHTRPNEHFGICIAEAIAAGAIPFVHNSGGQREIVVQDELKFISVAEAVKKIRSIMHLNDSDLARYRGELQSHVKRYSVQRFRNEIRTLISNLSHMK